MAEFTPTIKKNTMVNDIVILIVIVIVLGVNGP